MNLRVATFNVWAMPPPLGVDVSARMEAIGERLPTLNLDVLGLQEVWLPSARDALIEHGRRAGLRYSWSGDAGVRGAAGGLLLLSREPLTDVRFEGFSLRGDIERFEQGEYFGGKGYLRAILDRSDGRVQIINTHLHARYGKTAEHAYRPHRTAQLLQLAAEGLDPRLPVVLMGDFNFAENAPEYRIMRGLLGVADPSVELDARAPTVYAHNPYRPKPRRRKTLAERNRRKDFVFRRDGVARHLIPRKVERIFDAELRIDGRPAAYSNHAGVLVEFQLEARVVSGPGSEQGDRPDGAMAALAQKLLRSGRAAAVERAASQASLGWTGVAAAGIALAGSRAAPLSRRSLLRTGMRGLAGLAMLPAGGLMMSSSWLLPREVEAFDEASRMLARVGPPPGGVVAAPVQTQEELEGA